MDHTTGEPSLPRRRLLASGATALVAGLAGCNGGENADSGEPRDPVAYVSVDASLVVGVDMAVAENDATRRLVEAQADEDEATLFESFENRTGLDPSGADRVVAFSTNPHPERPTLLVEGSWSASDVVDAIETARGTTYESTDHDTGTVYEPADGGSTNPTLGVAANGQYLVGTGSNVRTALDVAGGSADGIPGPLRTAYTDARSADVDGTRYVSAATNDPRKYLPSDDSQQLPPGTSLDLYEELQTANAVYFVADGTVGLDIQLRADSEDVATQVDDFTTTIVAFLRNDVEDEAVAAELTNVRVERESTTVTVSYRSDVDGAVTLVEWL